MKINIISDGTRAGTSVVTESGEKLADVKKIEWFFNQEDGETEARITFRAVGLKTCEVDSRDREMSVL